MPIVTTISYGPRNHPNQAYIASFSQVKTGSPFTKPELEINLEVWEAFNSTQSPGLLLSNLSWVAKQAGALGVPLTVEVIQGVPVNAFLKPVEIRITAGAAGGAAVQTVMPPMWLIDP